MSAQLALGGRAGCALSTLIVVKKGAASGSATTEKMQRDTQDASGGRLLFHASPHHFLDHQLRGVFDELGIVTCLTCAMAGPWADGRNA